MGSRRKKRRQHDEPGQRVGERPDDEWDEPPRELSAEDKRKLDIMTEQYQAIRDILFLYWDLATHDGRIDGESEFGGFDRWKWLQCEADYDGGVVWRSYDDTLLLRQGSAVALLCEMDYEWNHYDAVDEQVWRVALEAGRFDLLPEARDAVEAGLQSQQELRKRLGVVYDEYVVACFEFQARSAQGGATPWSFRDPP